MEKRPIAVIVDDSQPFLMYLSLLLSRMNLEVLSFTDVLEAIEVSRVTPPNVMILDLVMPEINGLDALRSIRNDADLSDLSVIMVSGYQQKHLQWEALSLGCIDVLEKPLDVRRLHDAIQSCSLYRSGRRRYLRAPFEQEVTLHDRQKSIKVASVTLSERGIFLHMKDPLRKNTPVDIDLPLPSGDTLRAGGTVIYSKFQPTDGKAFPFAGIAVKFDRLTPEAKESLSVLVEGLLIDGIVQEDLSPHSDQI